MKKGIIIGVGLCLVLVAGLWFKSVIAEVDLRKEVNLACVTFSERAAMLSFELAEPYLEAEDVGDFEQRLGTAYPDYESYGEIMRDLVFGIEKWAMLKAPTDPGERARLLGSTPRDRIMELFSASGRLYLILLGLAPHKALGEVRLEFEARKAEMEALLAGSPK